MPTLKTVLEMDISAFRAKAEEARATLDSLAKMSAPSAAPSAASGGTVAASSGAESAKAAAAIGDSADQAAQKAVAAAEKISRSVKKAGEDAVAASRKSSAAAVEAASKSSAATGAAASKSSAATGAAMSKSKNASQQAGVAAQKTGQDISKAAGGVAAVSSALGGVNPQIGAIGQAVSSLATGPIGWITAAVTGLIALFSWMAKKAQDSLNAAAASARSLADTIEEKTGRQREKTGESRAAFDRLSSLDLRDNKTPAALTEMQKLVEILNSRYVGLNMTIDASTGKVNNLLEKQREAAKMDVKKNLNARSVEAAAEENALWASIKAKMGKVDGFESFFQARSARGYVVRNEGLFTDKDNDQAEDVADSVRRILASSKTRESDENILKDFNALLNTADVQGDDGDKQNMTAIIDALKKAIEAREKFREAQKSASSKGDNAEDMADLQRTTEAEAAAEEKKNAEKEKQKAEAERAAAQQKAEKEKQKAEAERAAAQQKADRNANRVYWEGLNNSAQNALGNQLGVAVETQIQKTKDLLGRETLTAQETAAATDVAKASENLRTAGTGFQGEATQTSIPGEIAAVGGWDAAIERRDPYDVNVAMLEQQRLGNELLAAIARNKSIICK